MSQPRTFSSLLDQHTGLLYKVFMEAMQAVRREFGSLKKISEISDVSVATLRRIYSNSFTFDRPPAMLTYEKLFPLFSKYLPHGEYHFPVSNKKLLPLKSTKKHTKMKSKK